MLTSSTLSHSLHQPDIQSVLEIYAEADPAAAKRASAALQVLLRDWYRSPQPESSWQTSLLTGDGFPLEVAFTPADADLRYTVEIDRSHPVTQRLALARQRLKQFTATIPDPLCESLQQLQQRGELTYGAWVGGRHGAQGDSYKLYAEVPAGSLESWQPDLKALQIPCPRLADRATLLRMIGYHVNAQRLEAYFRVANAERYHLQQLMALAGVSDRLNELWDFLEAAYGYRLRGKLPGGSVGISYSLSPEGRSPVFTVFLFARAFWGGDASIRQKLGAVAAQRGWQLGLYQRVSQPLAMHNTWKTYHGLLGVVVAPGQEIAISVGLRPWKTAPGSQLR